MLADYITYRDYFSVLDVLCLTAPHQYVNQLRGSFTTSVCYEMAVFYRNLVFPTVSSNLCAISCTFPPFSFLFSLPTLSFTFGFLRVFFYTCSFRFLSTNSFGSTATPQIIYKLFLLLFHTAHLRFINRNNCQYVLPRLPQNVLDNSTG